MTITQEEKVKAYDEAIIKAKELYDQGLINPPLEYIFPELTKSKDEMIRRLCEVLVRTCFRNKLCTKEEIDKCMAWLKKQGTKEVDPRYENLEELLIADNIYQMAMNEEMVEEAKSKAIKALSELEISKVLGIETQSEQKETLCDKCKKVQPSHSCQDITALGRCALEKRGEPIDKVESKFHEGDWICNVIGLHKISSIKNGMYYFDDGDIISIEFVDKYYYLWTINDTEKGDVLVDELGNILIYQEASTSTYYHSYCYYHLPSGSFIAAKGSHKIMGTKPATKKQRDILFAKMRELGYEWDVEKKKPKKIKPKFYKGDWVVQENIGVYKVIEVCESWYEVIDFEDNHYSISFDKEYMCHLWTIEDAKDGEVLAFDNDTIVIFKNLYNATSFHSYCCYVEDGVFNNSRDDMPEWWNAKGFHPATKEQRDIFFSKMWDADEKEIN